MIFLLQLVALILFSLQFLDLVEQHENLNIPKTIQPNIMLLYSIIGKAHKGEVFGPLKARWKLI